MQDMARERRRRGASWRLFYGWEGKDGIGRERCFFAATTERFYLCIVFVNGMEGFLLPFFSKLCLLLKITCEGGAMWSRWQKCGDT